MNQCELSVSGDLGYVSKRHVQRHKLCCRVKKETLKREFEHDSIASHKKNAPADLQAVWDDDCAYDIVYNIVYSIAYDISYHIVYDFVLIYDIEYKDTI